MGAAIRPHPCHRSDARQAESPPYHPLILRTRNGGPRASGPVGLVALVEDLLLPGRLHRAKELPKEGFKTEVERHLTGKETEPWEIIYFKLCKSQLPVVERALETAALMLGTDKSRGYCLEMICADFLAGANLDVENPDVLVFSLSRAYKLLPQEQQREFLEEIQGTPCPG